LKLINEIFFYQVHTLTIDTPYSIDLTLSNPLDVEIPVGEINFLTELDLIAETDDVKNHKFNLTIINFQSFNIPANKNYFVLSLNIMANTIGKFKIIGYIINSFNSMSKILFTDLVKKELNDKKNNNNNNSKIGLHAAYHLEVLPKLPIVNYFAFKSADTNECFEVTTQDITSICCYTGER